eukprot:scaffold11515_cov61-Cylindrotheca_fusiformis.AAC.1
MIKKFGRRRKRESVLLSIATAILHFSRRYVAPNNKLVREEQLDTMKYMEVAVPVTPLRFRRFYDWPPEPEYARVAKGYPPTNDPVTERLLEDDDFESYDEGYCVYDDNST